MDRRAERDLNARLIARAESCDAGLRSVRVPRPGRWIALTVSGRQPYRRPDPEPTAISGSGRRPSCL